MKDGCPSDCGLCPEYRQHACLGVSQVNTGCDLGGPICFADSGHQPDGYSITPELCATMLDAFVAAEGEPEVVMFSGGEPTIHKDILAMVDLTQQRPIGAVNLNTNGIRLASDRAFVRALGERNQPGRRVNVYPQFDGLGVETHLAIRDRDLREIKQRALDNCAEAALAVTLVAAVEKGVNEHEIGPGDPARARPPGGPVGRLPAGHPLGAHVAFDPLTRLTNSDVLHAIDDQLPELVPGGRLLPGAVLRTDVPIGHLSAHPGQRGRPGLRARADPAAARRGGPPRRRHQRGRARPLDP